MNTQERSALTTKFWHFLWSAILINLSVCLGVLVDGMIVGNLISPDGVSAINLTRPLIQFVGTINLLTAGGSSMLIGFALGKGDYLRVKKLFTLGLYTNVLVGLLMTVAGLLCPVALAGLLCNNEHMLQPTVEYLQPMLLGGPSFMIMWFVSMMVSVDGSPRLASLATIVDNVVNLGCDVLFIQWLGWGLAGSSVATVVGHLVGIAIMCRHFRSQDNHLHLSRQYDVSDLRYVISQGAPLGAASISFTVMLYSANSVVLSSMGRTGIFVFAVCMNIFQVYNLFLAGTCRTLQTLGAVQVGKGDNEAFGLVLSKSFRFITVAMTAICLLVWIAPQAVARFFGANTPEMISEASHALRVFALSFIPFCYIYALMIVYKLYGYHRMSLFISFALSLTVVPVLWIVYAAAPGLLWYSYLIAYAIEVLVIFVLHRASHVKFELSKAAKNL